MGHLSNFQKETCKAQTLVWLDELATSRREGTKPRDFEAEGKAALLDLEQIKKQYATAQTQENIVAYNNALGRALASVTLMYKIANNLQTSAILNNQTKKTLTEKFGIDAKDVTDLLNILSRPTLENHVFAPTNEKNDLVAEQLNTPEKVVEKKPPAEEVKVKKEEPVKEEPKENSPVAEPVAPAKKEPEWQKQTNLPAVKTTIPAAIVDGAIRLVKPERKEDTIPLVGSAEEALKAKEALDSALANRKVFQSDRSREAKDAFYHDMSLALIHYSHLTTIMDVTAGRESAALRSRFQNEFGILEKDLGRANSVIYRSERTVAQAWARVPGDETKIEDRLLKVGAPELKTTEIKEPEPKPVFEKSFELKPNPTVQAMPTEEFGSLEKDAPENDDRLQISVDVNRPIVTLPTVKKPVNPQINPNQLKSMKEWKEKFANESPDALEHQYLMSLNDYRDRMHGNSRDNTVGKLLALADKVKGTDTENNYVYNNVKNMLWENGNIPKEEFDVAVSSIDKPNESILHDLKDLKQREFDEQYKVPDAVKNFQYSKQMIDVNKKFFDNNFDIPKNDFLAFARKNWETLQNNVKNPPLAAEGNPQKDLLDASVGMYARIRSSYDKRQWYDVLFHPIDSYREYSLMKSMKETMKQNGMGDDQIEDLYTGAKEIFHLDDLDNKVSLNGKSSAAEANDKLIDIEEEKPQIQDNEFAQSLNEEFKEFHNLEQKAETKEVKAPTVEEPAKNNLTID